MYLVYHFLSFKKIKDTFLVDLLLINISKLFEKNKLFSWIFQEAKYKSYKQFCIKQLLILILKSLHPANEFYHKPGKRTT